MPKAYEFLADGFEVIEAMVPVDILHRGEVDVELVSVNGSEFVTSNDGITVKCNLKIEDIKDWDDVDLLMIPGGMPGATNLTKHEGVRQAFLRQAQKGKKVAAICAAPMLLGAAGLLKGRKATCFPGFEQYLEGAQLTHEAVTVDGNITTAEGPGAAAKYGFCLLSQLTAGDKAEEWKEIMRFKHVYGKEF